LIFDTIFRVASAKPRHNKWYYIPLSTGCQALLLWFQVPCQNQKAL